MPLDTAPRPVSQGESWEAFMAKHGIQPGDRRGVSEELTPYLASQADLAERAEQRDRYEDRDAIETWPAGGFV